MENKKTLVYGKIKERILTGALTSSAAFLALIIAKSDVVRELGLVAGLGILCELFAMFIIIPGLLGLRNHRQIKKGKTEAKIFSKIHIKSEPAAGVGRLIVRAPLVFAVVLLCIGAFFATQVGRVEVETNMMNKYSAITHPSGLNIIIVKEIIGALISSK